MADVTQILSRIDVGDPSAAEQLSSARDASTGLHVRDVRTVPGLVALQDRAQWCHFQCGDTAAVQDQLTIPVSALQEASVRLKRLDSVVKHVAVVVDVRVFVDHVEMVTADEANPEHDCCHSTTLTLCANHGRSWSSWL